MSVSLRGKHPCSEDIYAFVFNNGAINNENPYSCNLVCEREGWGCTLLTI